MRRTCRTMAQLRNARYRASACWQFVSTSVPSMSTMVGRHALSRASDSASQLVLAHLRASGDLQAPRLLLEVFAGLRFPAADLVGFLAEGRARFGGQFRQRAFAPGGRLRFFHVSFRGGSLLLGGH